MSTDDARFDMRRMPPQARRFAPVLVMIGVALVIAGLVAALASRLPATRIGDGEEYYAMQIAWADTHRPFMTETAWAEYDKVYRSNEIARFGRSTENLRSLFPELVLGSTGDFNHFWMYSALAASAQTGTRLLGLNLSRHQSFMLVHGLLFACVLLLAFRWQGIPGAAAWVLLAIGSPLLWYFNKVHTEFFTASLTVLAMAAAMKYRWAAAGLALALTSTQNISFVLPALIACVLALARMREAPPWQRPVDSALLALAALLASAHPAYYFFRYGAITPQLLAGGAKIDNVDPLVAFNFLFDLDLGLFPNWPLGILIAFVGVAAVFRKPPHGVGLLGTFMAVYAASALYAQSATSNINSGATVDVARYGLWYVCLLYPLLVWAWAMLSGMRRMNAAMVALLGLALLALNAVRFHPLNAESHLRYSPQARWAYSTLPWLFEPNQEIFRQRSTGAAAGHYPRPSIVLGPECRLALVLAGDNKNVPQVFGRDHCDMHVPSLIALLQQRGTWENHQKDYYLTLSNRDIASLFGTTPRGSVLHASVPGNAMSGYLESGWSKPEPWGVWSDGPLAQIEFSLRGELDRDLQIALVMKAFLPSGHRIYVVPVVNGKEHPSWVFSQEESMPVTRKLVVQTRDLVDSGGRIRLELKIHDPRSPMELGLSKDSRKLGIGLISMEIH